MRRRHALALLGGSLLARPALAQTRTIVDSAKRSVTLPAKVDKVFVAGPPASVLAYVRSGEVADAPEPLPGSFGALRLSGPPPGRSAFGDPPAPASVVPVTGGADDLPGQRTQRVLCVHNLSRFAQPAELMLAKWAGATPYEVLGRVPFPAITEEPYTVTLPPYGFLWFDLVPEEEAAGE